MAGDGEQRPFVRSLAAKEVLPEEFKVLREAHLILTKTENFLL
jgi:hypothetical protein